MHERTGEHAAQAARQSQPSGAQAQQDVLLQDLQRTAGNSAVAWLVGHAPPPHREPARREAPRQAAPRVVQRHASWEHRLLGDAPVRDLDAAAGRADPTTRQHVLEQERDRLRIWQRDPAAVTQTQIEATWPGIRVMTLRNGLILTYGELNTLGDYFSTPGVIDTVARGVLLPILQMVREQGFNRITNLLGLTRPVAVGGGGGAVPATEDFSGSAHSTGETGTLASVGELGALNSLTAGLGTDQYKALLSRNACHFSPFNWHRWEELHRIARDLALRGHAGNNAELRRQAWLNNGYADHFLQDSFAAGHLINKTRVMQLFVEWIAEHNSQGRWGRLWSTDRSMWNIDLDHWNQIRTMTTTDQPGISAPHLYGRGRRQAGTSADPQTAEDAPSQGERMATSGVQAGAGLTREQAYQNYLAFLNSAVIQAGAGALHDYFNERSLTVGSPAHPQAFQIWGDETLVTSGEGVRIAAETARMSQQAIDDLTRTGLTSVTPEAIREQFPDRVQAQGSPTMVPLEDWNRSLRTLLWQTIFPAVHYRIIGNTQSMMGRVSRDMVAGDASAPAPAPGAGGGGGSTPPPPRSPDSPDGGTSAGPQDAGVPGGT